MFGIKQDLMWIKILLLANYVQIFLFLKDTNSISVKYIMSSGETFRNCILLEYSLGLKMYKFMFLPYLPKQRSWEKLKAKKWENMKKEKLKNSSLCTKANFGSS